MTDASYIVDFKNNVEFMLTLTLYVNSDGVINDDKYDYDTIGLPFFTNSAKCFIDELSRKRRFVPDLSRFHMEYKKQSNDGRVAIEADN